MSRLPGSQAGRHSALECASVQALLPSLLGARDRAPATLIDHVEHCLGCRAELARYRRLLRLLRSLETEQARLPEGSLAEVLAGVSLAAERHAIRSTLANRRLAYVAGLAVSILAASAIALVAYRHTAQGRAPEVEGAA